jgi:hypothetical protein
MSSIFMGRYSTTGEGRRQTDSISVVKTLPGETEITARALLSHLAVPFPLSRMKNFLFCRFEIDIAVPGLFIV